MSTSTAVSPPGAPRAAAAGDVVAATALTKRFGEGDAAVDALRGVDVSFAPGSFTAIMGPSGSGKSTLMHILAGLDQPTSGSVEIAGTRLDALGDHDLTLLRRSQVGFIFQSYNLLPVLTAEENVLLPVRIAGEHADPAWLETLIETVGLGGPARAPPVRALRRPAAARRRRARADHPPRRRLRRRADRQPRLGVRPRRARPAAPRRRRVRPDDRHGHPRRRPRPRSPTASLFLADGRVVDEHAGLSVEEILDRLKAARMIALALRSLGERKLRTALTAIAVLLGVAMIAGTYVQTDRIRSAFESITQTANRGTDVVVTPARRRSRAISRRARRASTRRCSRACAPSRASAAPRAS